MFANVLILDTRVYFYLRCSSRLCSRSTTFRHVWQPPLTLIYSLSLNHHLNVDNTQHFFSFHPRNFDSNVAHLQTALQHIFSWMSANLLNIKTEFLIIGHKQQLAKIDNSSLNGTYSARNLFILWISYLLRSDLITCKVLHHQLLLSICIILPVKSASFFIPSTSSCSVSS